MFFALSGNREVPATVIVDEIPAIKEARIEEAATNERKMPNEKSKPVFTFQYAVEVAVVNPAILKLQQRIEMLPLPLPDTLMLDGGVLSDAQRQTLKECIMHFWFQEYTPEQIAGWLANIFRESSLNPESESADGHYFGLLQFGGSRLESLKQQEQWQTAAAQLIFTLHESETTQWYGKHEELLAACTPEEAAEIICRYYLRPSHKSREAKVRGELARQFYAQLYPPKT
ncbi:MAG: phage tail-type lysozyme domain-containing protein [Candidatus Nomurabacteria bacterium]|nr:phage tail-type lysozyme domain-containing protein [Candidatus Nomurabacteria bacterium]